MIDEKNRDCAAELAPLIAGARVLNGERKIGTDCALPGQERLLQVDATRPPTVAMDVTPPTSSDNVWTWVLLLFERAKALGITQPVFELRMLKTNQGTISGYFDSAEALTNVVLVQNRATGRSQREAIYVTLNSCAPELFARASNRVQSYAKNTTSDADIARRMFLPFDFDPDRHSGISSTDAEHAAAIERACKVRIWLASELRFPEPVTADSGNGAHLVYGVDLPNDANSLALINRCLAAVTAKFGDAKKGACDGGIRVLGDVTVGNAARIWKVYGSHARKGDATPTRPHRMARILSLPKGLATVPREVLEKLAAFAPSTTSSTRTKSKVKNTAPPGETALIPSLTYEKSQAAHEPDLDVPAWLEKHGLKVRKSKPYGDGDSGTLWELECCPMDPTHANNSACVIKFATGVVTAKCHHNSCTGKGWREWREQVGDPLPERRRVANLYTKEEIAAFAAQQGCTVEEFQLRWIIQRETAYYIFSDGRYLSPLLKSELPAALEKRDLARVPRADESPAGIDWYEEVVSDEGKVSRRYKPVDEMIEEYATVARKIVASMMEPVSKYDPVTQIFCEAACPLRSTRPAFDGRIDKWLRLLGGKDADKLLDWVATTTRLDRVTCALYLDGPKDFGKNMFAEGLARLWGNAATELRSLTGNFNSALLNSPLVFADEEVPANMTSGFLRSLVGSSSRALKRKFMPEAELLGAIRLVIAANNADLLKFDDEDFSEEDIKAVAARILYIRPDPGTGDYLRSLGGRAGTQGWVEGGDKIAAHALWLRENRVVKTGSRFLVEGEIGTIHRRLMTHGSIRGLVIEWIAKSLMLETFTANPGIQFGGGKLYVNAGYVKSTWENTIGDKRPPSLKKIGQALRPLAQAEKHLRLGKGRADFYDLRLEPIFEAMRELQVGTLEDYQVLIAAPRAYLTDLDDDTNAPPPPGVPTVPSGNPTLASVRRSS